MRRSREQEPIMNVYPPPGEPAVRTDESDFIPCARMTPPRVGRAEGLSFAQLAVQGARIDAGDWLLPAPVSRSPAGFVRVEPSGVLTLAGGAYFVACALSGRGGVGSAALELLPYDGANALDFARARAGRVPPDAFGALSYSFVLETRGEAALSFAPSVDDGQPLTDYTFSLALLRLR